MALSLQMGLWQSESSAEKKPQALTQEAQKNLINAPKLQLPIKIPTITTAKNYDCMTLHPSPYSYENASMGI